MLRIFSGRGESPHRRYFCLTGKTARERALCEAVSRSGAMPEPTVIVWMKENEAGHTFGLCHIYLRAACLAVPFAFRPDADC